MGSRASCCGDISESIDASVEHADSQRNGKAESSHGLTRKQRFQTKDGGFQALAGSTVVSSSSSSITLAHMVRDSFKMPTLSSFVEIPQSDQNSDTESQEEHDDEEPVEPKCFIRPRRNAVSNEATGMYNPRHAGLMLPTFKKTPEQEIALRKAIRSCPFFTGLDASRVNLLVSAMPLREVLEGQEFIQQGKMDDSAYVLLLGDCVVVDKTGMQQSYNPQDSSSTVLSAFERLSSIRHSMGAYGNLEGKPVGNIRPGRFFGEMAMIWCLPRTVSVYTTTNSMIAELRREVYNNLVVLREIENRNRKVDLLRRVKLLETFSEEDITQLSDASEVRIYEEKDVVIKQGDFGNEFFIVKSGEFSARICTGSRTKNRRRTAEIEGVLSIDSDSDNSEVDVQEHRRYGPGDLFGEKAIIQETVRAATVIALRRSELLVLTRRKFQRLLGRLEELGNAHYLTDPRKDIAEFYKKGNAFGPAGSILHCGAVIQGERLKQSEIESKSSEWFAVYRPTSRDAISRLLSGTAVGKGLNVKGKSAKCGRLSGFVPFLQIHDNNHKNLVEAPPWNSWIMVFYQSDGARAQAASVFQAAISQLRKVQPERAPSSESLTPESQDPYQMVEITAYTAVFGLDVPECVICDVYIQQPDLSFLAGWETGRNSEPAFMDMNLQSLRKDTEPKVVLFQSDTANPMNPHGLLLAYAESKVKPLVSDFDTFLVGSKGVIYDELPPEQVAIASWSLDSTLKILQTPEHLSWSKRWLEILDEEDFHPEIPKYGFGDATSYRLITEAVSATIASGAVRHGAECFNYYFPQDLDEEYLVVSETFENKPWAYMKEEQLRTYLLQKVADGFSFPLNPVWLVRDPSWYEVFEALLCNEEARINLTKWMPESSGLMEKIKTIHNQFPNGFHRMVAIESEIARVRAESAADLWVRNLKRASSIGRSHISDSSNDDTVNIEAPFVSEFIDKWDSEASFLDCGHAQL